MLRSLFLLLSTLCVLITISHGQSHHSDEEFSTPTATFIKPKASILHRLNPLKLFFTVVHTPHQIPEYSVEWNLPLLRTMLLESTQVSDEDKVLFLTKFSNVENDYANWSPEQHDQLERFTQKYFNLYESPESFLPFLDCTALTYAITDEIINGRFPNGDEKKRFIARKMAVQRLCHSE